MTPRSLQARMYPKSFTIQQGCRISNKSIGWGQRARIYEASVTSTGLFGGGGGK